MLGFGEAQLVPWRDRRSKRTPRSTRSPNAGRGRGAETVSPSGVALQADVAGLQLLVIEHADAAAARLGVAVEREVHFLDAMALGAGAELGLGAGRGAAEQDVVGFVHVQLSDVS